MHVGFAYFQFDMTWSVHVMHVAFFPFEQWRLVVLYQLKCIQRGVIETPNVRWCACPGRTSAGDAFSSAIALTEHNFWLVAVTFHRYPRAHCLWWVRNCEHLVSECVVHLFPQRAVWFSFCVFYWLARDRDRCCISPLARARALLCPILDAEWRIMLDCVHKLFPSNIAMDNHWHVACCFTKIYTHTRRQIHRALFVVTSRVQYT